MAKKQNTRTREIWKPVPGCPGYEVSNLGRARSLDRVRHNGGFLKGRILRQGKGATNSPYYYFAAYHGRRQQKMRLHQAVLLAFCGPKPPGMVCCHNNGNKLDNRLENLRYDTPRNNVLDRALHGTDNTGERHGMSKLTDDDVRSILKASIDLERELSQRFNVTESNIRAIVTRRRWRHLSQ